MWRDRRPAEFTGATGRSVRALQRELDVHRARDATGRRLHADGVFGQRTESAVRSFQHAQGLVPDGIFGPETRMALEPARLRPLQAVVLREPHGSDDQGASWRRHPAADAPAERLPADDPHAPPSNPW